MGALNSGKGLIVKTGYAQWSQSTLCSASHRCFCDVSALLVPAIADKSFVIFTYSLVIVEVDYQSAKSGPREFRLK